MSYASLIRILPESFRSTNGMAAVASLGIHGLLLIVLPFLPLDSQLAATMQQRTVGLVELTPEEQGRLPGASVPPALPPFAAQESVLPPLPPPPPFPVGALPPLPDPIALPPSIGLPPPPSNNSFQAALRPNQTFIMPVSPQQSRRTTTGVPREPQNNQTFSIGSTLNAPPPPPVLNTLPPPPPLGNLQPPPVAAAPNRTPNRPYNSGELLPPIPQWQQPTNTGLPSIALQPSENFSPEALPPGQVAQIPTPPNLVQPQQQPQQPQQPQQQVAAAPPAQPVESGSRSQQLPERGRQELLARQQQIREERAAPPPAAASAPPVEPHTAEPSRQQLVAALRNQQTTRDNNTAAESDNTAEPSRQQLVAALRNQQTPAGSGSSPSAAAQRDAQLQAWAEREDNVQQNHSNVATRAPIYETIKSCQRGLEGVAVLGVVVNPEGRVVSGPDFLSRQGAADIEQAARAYIQAYDFPKSDSAVNQQFHLQYQYDTANCAQPPEASPQQQPEQPQQSDA